jgi:hypothetical protein
MSDGTIDGVSEGVSIFDDGAEVGASVKGIIASTKVGRAVGAVVNGVGVPLGDGVLGKGVFILFPLPLPI